MRIVFLLENGIGFGHCRRALVLADALRALSDDVDPCFVTQARSLALFGDRPYTVFNFPSLYRLPNNVTERTYWTLLDELLWALDPALVVEDTYPDDRFLSLSAVRDVRKALILRRVDPSALEIARQSGQLAEYDRIIILQERGHFLTDQLPPGLDILARFNQRIRFTGPVFHQSTVSERSQVIARYRRDVEPLIVVNAGAGGEHVDEGSCARLFQAAETVSECFARENRRAHFVLVLGPYYRGRRPTPRANLTVVEYEPLLPALLAVADVVVARPGFNAIHEALTGPAHVISVPGVSYQEQQPQWSAELGRRFAVRVWSSGKGEDLYEEIVSALAAPRRLSRPTDTSSETARCLLDVASAPLPEAVGAPCFLLIGGLEAEWMEAVTAKLRVRALHIHIVVDCQPTNEFEVPTLAAAVGSVTTEVALASAVDGYQPTPTGVLRLGVRALLIIDRYRAGFDGPKWLAQYHPEAYGLLTISLTELHGGPRWLQHLGYRWQHMRYAQLPPCLYANIGAACSTLDQIEQICAALEHFSQEHQVRWLSLQEVLDIASRPLLGGGRWQRQPLDSDKIG